MVAVTTTGRFHVQGNAKSAGNRSGLSLRVPRLGQRHARRLRRLARRQPAQTLLGIAQVVMLGELAVNQVLDHVVPVG